ncbi:MAG: response regulator transcription factor [Patescibacteria group bacterium]
MTKILLIEDDEVLSGMYKMKMKQEGYDVVLADNGENGLEKAKTDKPDIILLDLILPQKDGYQVLEELKQSKETKDIKVFILSNLGQNGEIKKGKEMGAEDYFIKADLTPGQLVEKIKKRLQEDEK